MRLPPLLPFTFSLFSLSAALYSPLARWGQAIAVIDDVLFVYGGKTDPYNSYGYTSAPWNNDLLSLSLTTSFDPSAPPWQYIAGSQNASSPQGTTLAWHTLSAFNSSFCLIFGGDTGPLSNIVQLDNADSAQLLNLLDPPAFLTLPDNWAGEPQRRMRHATASAGGKLYIIGGEAADGSGNTFSTHYLFDPTVPTFTQLPTQNSPPGIFGHAVVILFDGRLLVFGGISGGQLVPFSTIWILDTTQSTLTWILASIDGSSLPSPRASFAVVLLDDGRILIQGGTDAAFQTNVADGWILDPSKNPMTWTAVPALSQVGARRDHFAVSAAGQVVFGFGYGDNGPADTTAQVYNVGSSTFQPTFSPMTTPPAHTTLPPDPSQTITTKPPGSTQTRSNGNPLTHSGPSQSVPNGGHTGSQTVGRPSSTGSGGSGPGNSGNPLGGSESNKAAIAIGAVLGGLGFTAGAALVVWYLRRRHARSGHPFNPLDDHDDEEYPHSITAVHLGGTHDSPRILAVPLSLLGMIGIGSRRRDRSRRDILADEDRSFDDWIGVSREGSGARSSLRTNSARNSMRGLSNAITERFTSIRNLALGTSSNPHSRAPSTNWEKTGGDPFSSEVGLARDKLPEHGFAPPGPSQPYIDPYADDDTPSFILRLYDTEPEAGPNHAPERKEQSPTEKRPTPIHTTLPPPTDFVPMSPVLEQGSQNSLSKSSSSHSHYTTNSDQHAGSSSSHGATRSPRLSSILDPSPPASPPIIRRTNSWWMRFAKTPLLERRLTESSSRSNGFMDIRDPNPPPRLLTIEETAHSREGTAEATPSRRRPSAGANRAYPGTPSRKPSLYYETHGRSASSLQTANTETLERLGGTMDIVQRDGTLDSQHSPLTGLEDEFGVAIGGGGGSGSYTQQLRALLVRGEPSYHSARTASSSVSASIDSPMVHSPLRSAAGSPTGELTHPVLPSSPTSEEASGSSPRSPGVAERVRAFERRLSRDSAPPPPPTNTRQREERLTPPPVAAPRPAVRYGLVQRPSLFVANPDGAGGRSSEGG